jgi:CDP-diacylglycerol--glycerol-3-phosphate 3-phosphatidyltransferase
MSLGRLLLAAVIVKLILQPGGASHVLAAVLFAVGSLTDFLDGWLARKLGVVSDFGKFMDPLADKFLILLPMAAFTRVGYLNAALVYLIFVREIVVTFCRIGFLRQGRAVAAEMLGKLKLGSQVALLSFCLIRLMIQHASPDAADSAGWNALLLVTLIGVTTLTMVSGYSFFRANRELLLAPEFVRYVCALGVGLSKTMPGTWGSALGLVLALIVRFNTGFYVITFLMLFLAGYWAFSRLPSSEKENDPRYFVVDEAVAMMLALAGLPMTPAIVISGFFLFRFFDVLKPLGLRKLESLPGFWGVMADDLGGALYTWILLQIFF